MRSALQQLRESLAERFPAACRQRVPAGVLPTGESELDARLAGGGLPKGCLVELEGGLSSGKGAFVDRMAAALTAGGGRVAYLDLPGTFYPPALDAAGARLDRLLVVRPRVLPQALWACELLVRSQGFELVLLDLTVRPAVRLAAAPLHRLARVAEQGESVVLFLTDLFPEPSQARVLPAGTVALRLRARQHQGLTQLRVDCSNFQPPELPFSEPVPKLLRPVLSLVKG